MNLNPLNFSKVLHTTTGLHDNFLYFPLFIIYSIVYIVFNRLYNVEAISTLNRSNSRVMDQSLLFCFHRNGAGSCTRAGVVFSGELLTDRRPAFHSSRNML